MRDQYYCFQLVGNERSVKRMIAYLYLINARHQEQTIRVCICDDLPHIVEPFNEDQKKDPSSELLETDLSVSVNYERTLTVSASESSTHYESRCIITPNHELVIPPETIWTAGAAVVVDFKVRMLKANDSTSIQISIMSQDDTGNDIPLSVPPRIRLTWQPHNVAGVTRLREAWEETSDGSMTPQRSSWAARHGPQPYSHSYGNFGHKSVTMPRHVQPAYSKVESVVQKKMTKMQEIEAQLKQEEQRRKWEEERKRMIDERKPTHSATSSQSSEKKWSGSSVSSYQDSDWNVVRDPLATRHPTNNVYNDPHEDAPVNNVYTPANNVYNDQHEDSEHLPSWAQQGLGDDFNYDDVVVV